MIVICRLVVVDDFFSFHFFFQLFSVRMLPWMSCLVIQKRYISFNSLSQFRPFLGSSPVVQHVSFCVLTLVVFVSSPV